MSLGFTITHSPVNFFSVPAVQRQLVYKSPNSDQVFYFNYQTNDKFSQDKLFSENEEYIYGIDGPILNLSELKKSHTTESWPDLFIYLFEKHNQRLPAMLKGDFCGFIFKKPTEELIVFNNPGGSRRMYYTQRDHTFIVASSLSQVAEFYHENQQLLSLNHLAAYSLLTYGTMCGNWTLMDQVYRLQAGTSLKWSNRQLTTNRYIDYNQVNISKSSEKDLLAGLDERFTNALRLEMEKDRFYGYQSIGTLSGGLDSRMVMMLAHKMGFDVDPFCFSQTGYHDEVIARKIAGKMRKELTFFDLDKPTYVYDFEENLSTYDGLSFYLGSAHFNWVLGQLDLSKTGLIHTGLIGDGVFGGALSGPVHRPPDPRSKVISAKLYPKIAAEMAIFARDYANEETFMLYNRMFNLTITGAYICAPYGYHSTPFMDPELMQHLLSIPPELKYFHRLYIRWINQYHPETTRFKWERTRMRPTAHWKTKASRFTNKAEQLYRKWRNQEDLLNMVPLNQYQRDKTVKEFFDHHYQTKIHLLKENAELKRDADSLFKNGSLMERSMVLTLLGAVERFRLKV